MVPDLLIGDFKTKGFVVELLCSLEIAEVKFNTDEARLNPLHKIDSGFEYRTGKTLSRLRGLRSRNLGRLRLVEMTPNGLSGFAGDDCGERNSRGLLYVAQAAEVGQQALAGLLADAGDVEKLRVTVAHGAALTVIADGEAVALIADHLDEV